VPMSAMPGTHPCCASDPDSFKVGVPIPGTERCRGDSSRNSRNPTSSLILTTMHHYNHSIWGIIASTLEVACG
jgi:hypothetical protein